MGEKSPAEPKVTICPTVKARGYQDDLQWISSHEEEAFKASVDWHTKIHWARRFNPLVK